MREYFLFSKPTAFFKAHKPIEVFFNEPIGGGEDLSALHGKVNGPRGRVHGEASFWNLFWWLNTDDAKIEASSLTAARKKYLKLRAHDDGLEEVNDSLNDTTQEPIESWPPNEFGRGQAASSFLRSSVSTGFRPKPITQWRLLGGAGASGKPTKKKGPASTKAQDSQKGNYIFITTYLHVLYIDVSDLSYYLNLKNSVKWISK